MNSTKLPEVFLQRALVTHLHSLGYRVREEQAYGGMRLDAVAYDGTAILGFEVKLSNWTRAFAQARRYKRLCDKVYLVVPEPVSLSLHERCRKENVGLISLDAPPDWKIRFIVSPGPNGSRSTAQRLRLIEVAALV